MEHYQHEHIKNDAGFDLYSPIDLFALAHTQSRIICFTGVIDSGYTGEIAVVLNAVDDYLNIKKGDRIAQLVIAKLADINDAVAVDSLEDSERGAGGFGSTGA